MSQAFYVPSVPRALLLPVLDTYKMPTEDDDADPTPPGSHVSPVTVLVAAECSWALVRRGVVHGRYVDRDCYRFYQSLGTV